MMDPMKDTPLSAQIESIVLRELVGRGEARETNLEPGDVLSEHDLSNYILVLLEGELEVTTRIDGRKVRISTRESSASENVPRVVATPQIARAGILSPSRVLKVSSDSYLEGIAARSPANQIIVSGLIWRVQNAEALMRHREKLAALGKLAAGLAHEMNNPASANSRASSQLGDAFRRLQQLDLQLRDTRLTAQQTARLAELQSRLMEVASHPARLTPLEQSDLEEAAAGWMDSKGIDESWKLAPSFVAVGADVGWMQALEEDFLGTDLKLIVPWLEATITAWSLIYQIGQATSRITELVSAVKRYVYMDRSPLQKIDVHEGIESTIIILGHKLKKFILTRDYDQKLPNVCAYAGELNQVWTNLIDNAADALESAGKSEDGEIVVRTAREDNHVLVEVIDNGPGIAPENQSRIFEPFFSTKGNGAGVGLGLDITYRIVVERNHGDITFTSHPGETRFQVRLPLDEKADSD